MAATVGSTILADDYNALFERLEVVRKKHYAANGLSSSQQSALKTNIPTKVAVKGQTILTSNAKALKSALEQLGNSPYISTTFASNVKLPAVGDLIKLTLYELMETQVSKVEELCANCTFFAANFSSNFNNCGSNHSNCSNYGNSGGGGGGDSNFGNVSHSNQGNAPVTHSNQGNVKHSNFSNYRPRHGSDFTNPQSGWT